MSGPMLIGLVVFTLACVALAQRMAAERGRSAKPWMWSAALFGPIPLAILAFLPRKV